MSPHNSGGGLTVDAEQITQIAHAVFKHASDGLTVSIRAFYEGQKAVFQTRSVLLNGDGLQLVVDAAVPVAQAAANVSTPVVFCPIPATFKDGSSAKEANLAEGLVLLRRVRPAPPTGPR